jgi:isochorismate synthase EntC
VGPYHPDSAGRSDANPVSNFVSYCSPKDDNEFGIVRENVKKHLEAVCSKVEEEFHKRVIKQARVQHLYTRLVGQLKNKSSEVSFRKSFLQRGFIGWSGVYKLV